MSDVAQVCDYSDVAESAASAEIVVSPERSSITQVKLVAFSLDLAILVAMNLRVQGCEIERQIAYACNG